MRKGRTQLATLSHTACCSLYARATLCFANETCDAQNNLTHDGTATASVMHGTLVHPSSCMPLGSGAEAASNDLVSIGRISPSRPPELLLTNVDRQRTPSAQEGSNERLPYIGGSATVYMHARRPGGLRDGTGVESKCQMWVGVGRARCDETF